MRAIRRLPFLRRAITLNLYTVAKPQNLLRRPNDGTNVRCFGGASGAGNCRSRSRL
jgi:hypothetical protein